MKLNPFSKTKNEPSSPPPPAGNKLAKLYKIIAIALILAIPAMFAQKYYSGHERTETALKNTQRIIIDLEDGKQLSLDDINLIKSGKRVETEASQQKEKPVETVRKVAIIITGLGLNAKDTEAAIALPPEFILSFSPYAADAPLLSKLAAENGHEIAVDLPMQSKSPESGGRLAISSSNNEFRNLQNLSAVLAKVYRPLYVITPTDENFSQSPSFNAIMREIGKQGLAMVFTSEDKSISIESRANTARLDLFRPDIVIPAASSYGNLKLKEFESKMESSTFGLLVVPASADTLKVVKEWHHSFEEKKFELVPSL